MNTFRINITGYGPPVPSTNLLLNNHTAWTCSALGVGRIGRSTVPTKTEPNSDNKPLNGWNRHSKPAPISRYYQHKERGERKVGKGGWPHNICNEVRYTIHYEWENRTYQKTTGKKAKKFGPKIENGWGWQISNLGEHWR